ncbi:MAG: SH3 domain-containing protein [Nitrospirota bacterium]
MARRISLLTIPFLILLCCTSLIAQDVYYVQSLKAKVMSTPSFKSEVLGEVSKGYRFVSTGKEGNWVKVRYNSKDGYVSALLLSNHPPIERQALITGEESEIKESVRRRVSTFASAAAARGLTQEDRKRLSREEEADYESLEEIESFSLSTEEIIRFMEESKK